MKKRLIFALTLLGLTSMVGQIVLMRELMVVFYGNELSLGIALATWLFWVAFGSWGIGRRIADKTKRQIVTFAICQIAAAFIFVLSLLAVRAIPSALRFTTGEIIGILPMTLASFVLLAPICLLGGFLFVLGCGVCGTESGKAAQIGYVYILEAIGAVLGGLIASFLLIHLLSPSYIMFLVGILNLVSAFLLLQENRFLSLLALVAGLGFILVVVLGMAQLFEIGSLRLQWKGHNLIASENSIYGNIAVTKTEDQHSIFTNGIHDFTVPDRLTSERNAHFPLLEHPAPEDVLLIGGGSSGMLKEVLKHPVKSVDYVELDPLVIKLAKRYLPLDDALKDDRVKIIPDMDGRLFIKRTDRKYDAVIISLPEPYTAQLNRFYTREFYKEVSPILKDRGILSFFMHSNPNYISEEQAELYRTLENTLRDVFAEVVITPGESNCFLASNIKGILTLDWRILMERLKKREIDAMYMREYFLESELSQERIDSFHARLAQSKNTTINRDLRPIGYYYNLILWATYFKYNLKGLFKAIDSKKIYLAAVFLFISLLVFGWIGRLKRKLQNWAVLVCIGTTGFAEITFQIATLIAFQVIYGYVFYKLGIIMTSFMLGLILGALWITRRMASAERREARGERRKDNGRYQQDYRLFVRTQVLIFLYPLLLPLIFWAFLQLKGKAGFWVGSCVVFPFLPVIPGLLGGFQFPLANRLYLERIKAGVGRSAGLTYGIDLFGSCIGALLASVFLLPVIGLPMTCVLVAGLNLIGLILLLF